MDLDFRPDVVFAHMPQLIRGAETTFLLSIAAILLGGTLGLVVCALRLSPSRLLVALARGYVSFFRGTPLLVQLLVIFYVPTAVGIDTASLPAALIGLSLNTAAYQSEIYRGGFATIPRGQREAARVLGMGRWQIDRFILIPQVFRLTLPALTNEVIDVLKSSALVSVIAVTDLLRVSQQLVAVTYRPLEFYLAAASLYFMLTSFIAVLGRLAERRLNARL